MIFLAHGVFPARGPVVPFLPDRSVDGERFSSERNVLRGRGVGAACLVDTEQALLGRVRPAEADTAGCHAGGARARPRHGRDRAERRVPAVENVREFLGGTGAGTGRESEQLVREGSVVRPEALASPGSRLQHRHHADAPATDARR